MPKMIEISAAEYERLQDCIREDGMRIAALIEENKALHQAALAAEAGRGGGCRMIETPKCPYCGAEMIRTDDITTACMSRRYTCRECGSAAPQVNELNWAKFPEVSERAREAALSRSEPKNRVLTLEELKAHCAKGRDAEPLWAEFKEECAISRWIFAVIPPDVFDRPVLSEWIATDRSEKYGKEWRCWPRKPTPEQMAAEKWEE